MKNNCLIVCISGNTKNTEKIAFSMAKVMDAKVVGFREFSNENLNDYDLIGFGAGIYFSKHNPALLKLVKNLPEINKDVFIFSTNTLLNFGYHNNLRKILKKKGCTIKGEFSCPALNIVGPLKLFGGMNKGRPNNKDIEKSVVFAKQLLK